MLKKNMYAISIIIISLIISIIALPYLPNEVPTHWGINGQPDGYSNKYMGSFMAPFFMVLMLGLLKVSPKLDPKKRNYPKFLKSYNGFVNVMVTFFLVIHVVTLSWALGYEVNIENTITVGLAGLFMYIGNIMPKIKPNYFFGIRTPWTLDNEEVWRRTHRFGGKITFLSGVLLLFTLFLSGIGMFVALLAIVLVTSVTQIIYSYVISQKIKGE